MTPPQEKKEPREFKGRLGFRHDSGHWINSGMSEGVPDKEDLERGFIHLVEHAALVASQNEVEELKRKLKECSMKFMHLYHAECNECKARSTNIGAENE